MAKQDAFGKVIKARRKALDLSLRYVSEGIGITSTYLLDIERGNRVPPASTEIIDKLFEILQFSNEEKKDMLYLACIARKKLTENLTEYIFEKTPMAVKFLIVAMDKKLTDSEFEELIEVCKRIEGGDGFDK